MEETTIYDIKTTSSTPNDIILHDVSLKRCLEVLSSPQPPWAIRGNEYSYPKLGATLTIIDEKSPVLSTLPEMSYAVITSKRRFPSPFLKDWSDGKDNSFMARKGLIDEAGEIFRHFDRFIFPRRTVFIGARYAGLLAVLLHLFYFTKYGGKSRAFTVSPLKLGKIPDYIEGGQFMTHITNKWDFRRFLPPYMTPLPGAHLSGGSFTFPWNWTSPTTIGESLGFVKESSDDGK